jgi:predicted metal-binding membrane protein
MALAFAAYLGAWGAFGVLALGGVWLARSALGVEERLVLAVSLAAAAAWQLTRFKRRAIFACTQTVPLPPIGRRADAACLRLGLRQGARGIRSCWALMAVIVALGASSTVWMLALTALIVLEDLTLVGRRLLRPSAVVLGLAAVVVVAGPL